MVELSNYKKRCKHIYKRGTEALQFHLSPKKLSKYQNTVLFKYYCITDLYIYIYI